MPLNENIISRALDDVIDLELIAADAKEAIIDQLFDDHMKAKILDALNENINIPIIGEETERKILDAIYDTVKDIVRQAIMKTL